MFDLYCRGWNETRDGMEERKQDKKLCQFECSENESDNISYCRSCYISTEIGRHTRRCFMTGEYCSQQMNIQKERDRIYGENKIRAFVVMNFSDMSDVVYKWKIRSFVKSVVKYLYIDKKNKRLYCYAAENDVNKTEKYYIGSNVVEPVEEIEVIRADSDPASNYVICSRICQQMQIADLIVVDVSNQNPNVFYEFGIAVALGKLILPMCYSESFYKRTVPEKLKKILAEQTNNDQYIIDLENYIGCYPWRKKLFEYYGIYYKQKESKTNYVDFKYAADEKYGFSDVEYSRFPYHEKISNQMVGKRIYDLLKESYNCIPKSENTLIVYTMEGFLNEGEAGKCIVNYYLGITYKLMSEQCFCGERVGVLAQSNSVSENDKDTYAQVNIPYNIGEIIRTGINQATYLASIEQIHAEDVFKISEEKNDETESDDDRGSATQEQKKAIKVYVKDYIRNRGMIIYPNSPVYVERLKSFLQNDLLQIVNEKEKCWLSKFFCFYHAMLRTLRYVNELVVDITNTNNCFQSLFWLGTAHGAGIYAITVKYEFPKTDKLRMEDSINIQNRNIFDVAGLWTAIYYTHNTDLFYKQLAMAQKGIERHSRLMLPDSKADEKEIREYISSELKTSVVNSEDILDTKIIKRVKKRYAEEKKILESFYRKKFWSQMLRYNRLRLYISNYDDKDIGDDEPRIRVAKWDFDAVSALTHYLSKRSAIGEYKVKSLQENEKDHNANEVNFLCVGKPVKPTGKTLVEDIYSQRKDTGTIIHEAVIFQNDNLCKCIHKNKKLNYKGFKVYTQTDTQKEEGLFTQHPVSKCEECCLCKNGDKNHGLAKRIFHTINEAKSTDCMIKNSAVHMELAQLILWREEQDSSKDVHFRVSLTGSSGPATLALSMLFVEEKLEDISGIDEAFLNQSIADSENSYRNYQIKKKELLCELQTAARKKVLELYNEKLECKLEEIEWEVIDDKDKVEIKECRSPQIQRYFDLVKYSTTMYLSTILYRYFLPFLSDQDINRIKNGMWSFVSSMNSARLSPFAINYPSNGDPTFEGAIVNENIESVAQKIPETIEVVLKQFKGMEVFYQVEVQHRQGEREFDRPGKDTRKIKNIQLLDKDQYIFYCI